MKQLYKGTLGCFEYDDTEVEIVKCYDTQFRQKVKWLGSSSSITIKGILYSMREMFAESTLPEGFVLNLDIRELTDVVYCFRRCSIPDNFTLDLNFDGDCSLYGMFANAIIGDGFKCRIKAVNAWDIMTAFMFSHCEFKGSYDLGIPMDRISDASGMFGGTKFAAATELTLEFPKVNDVSGLFAGTKFPEGSYVKLNGAANRANGMFEMADITKDTIIDFSNFTMYDAECLFTATDIATTADIRLNLANTRIIHGMFWGAIIGENFNLDLFVRTDVSSTEAFESATIPDSSSINIKVLNRDVLSDDLVARYEEGISEIAHKSKKDNCKDNESASRKSSGISEEALKGLEDLNFPDLNLF